MAKKKAPPAPKAPRKIAILGNADVSLTSAPYDDPSWKKWDMANNFWKRKPFDYWFEIHTPDTLKAKGIAIEYADFLKNCGSKLIVGHPSEMWPQAQIFPIMEVVTQFGDYFNCSFAYMMAFALMFHDMDKKDGGAGIAQIGLWGIDMAVGEEYAYQKACGEYWVGMARGKGIDVYIAPESPMCRTNAMYGFDNPKLSREFTDRLTDIDKDIKKTNDERAELQRQVDAKNVQLIELSAVRKVLKEICHRWSL